jgi:hypothetical protein
MITQASQNNQTNMAQCLIVGIPAQIANRIQKSLSAAALPPVLKKNGKKRRGAAKTTQAGTTDPT